MHFLLKKQNDYKSPESTLKNYGCYRISNYFEIHTNGDISLCCYEWLKIYCGNILVDSYEMILNNTKRLQLIKDMSNGIFTECTDVCPYLSTILNQQKNTSGYIVPIEELQKEINNKPITINFSYDRSCNLQCPSCRNELILYQNNQNELIKKIHNKVKGFVEFLLNQNFKLMLYISGTADPFASPTYWEYLKELSLSPNPDRKLKLLTNGTLMNKERLNEIKPIWGEINQLGISVDAATENTYSIVRKNGSFNKLKVNLQNIVNLINNNQFINLNSYIINFTVQKQNFREIKQFVEWQLSYNTKNKIYFSIVSQWGHINDHMFENNFMLNSAEKKELAEILKDPIFTHPQVICGNLYSII